MIDNIWGADLADFQLISKFNKGFGIFCCVYSKYAWVIPLKDKKVLPLPMLFRKLWTCLVENHTKYGLIKAMNFIIDQWNHG